MKTYLTLITLLLMCLTVVPQATAQDAGPGTPLFVSGTNDIAEFRIPALQTTPTGRVLAVCDARVDRSGDVPNNIDLVLRYSDDDGETWSDLQRIIDYHGTEGGADPCLLADRDTGTIYLFYAYSAGRNNVTQGPNAERRHLAMHYVYSEDDGETWSLPIHVDIAIHAPEWHSTWPSPGRGVQLQNGRLIIPASAWDHEQHIAYFVYSDDHGKTWQRSTDAGDHICEPRIIEREDGTLVMNARNTARTSKRGVVTSDDGGQTWSAIQWHDTLIESSCQASFLAYDVDRDGHPTDVVVFSNPASERGRVNMTVRVSRDAGQTWDATYPIHAGPSAYSSMTVLSDGSIGLLYENGRRGAYEGITFVRIPAEELGLSAADARDD